MILHIIALVLSVVLDWIIGDPYKLPHPIRAIGRFIAYLDKKFMGPKENISCKPNKELRQGAITCTFTILCTGILTGAVLIFSYMLSDWLGFIIEIILGFYTIAAKSLYVESMKVSKALDGDILEARYAVSMIVGRDTDCLDEKGIIKAAVETVAENTSDGVIAPLIYLAIGGPILGLIYKAVNTMDSMIGYRNDRYEYYGKVAAKLDDIVNYIPARFSAILMIAAAFIYSLFDKEINPKNSIKIFLRDRYNHKSPNSAQTESVSAGALGLKLLGDASYFGKIVHKPTVGDELRTIERQDIFRANVLMFITEVLLVVCIIFFTVIAFA